MGIFDRLFKPNVERLQEEKNVKGLIKALRHKDEYVREEAARALGEIGDERAVEPLIQALKDEDRYVRRVAARALGEIGDERAVEPLIQALKDEDRDVREEAAGALGEIRDERAVEPLTQALKDEDRYVRRRAAGALGNIFGKRKPKIKYLIITTNRTPPEGEVIFINFLLDNLYFEGVPYRIFIDEETKIKILFSHDLDYDDESILETGYFALGIYFGLREPVSDNITCQKFRTHFGFGYVVAEWNVNNTELRRFFKKEM